MVPVFVLVMAGVTAAAILIWRSVYLVLARRQNRRAQEERA
ncbi:MAG: hypothetical protein AB1449_01525 [Chloroflexota bacterium]